MGALPSSIYWNHSGEWVQILSAQHVLFQFDILIMIFDLFDLDNIEDRVTCARCARVCRVWVEPAAHSLWGRRKWRLLDLYNVLHGYKPAGKNTSLVVDDSWEQPLRVSKLRDSPRVQESFLRCAAHVRTLRVSQVSGPNKAEVRLLQRLLGWGQGTTFLPSLTSLSWIETPATDRLLPLLVPSQLEHLELILDAQTSSGQVNELLTRLPAAAPNLRRAEVFAWGDFPFPLDSLTPNVSIKQLSLHGHIIVSPDQLQVLLTLPALESLHVRITDFDAKCTAMRARCPLTSFTCVGTYEDVTALVTVFHAQKISHLGLQVETTDSFYSPSAQSRLGKVLVSRKFPALRSLQLGYRNVQTNPRQPQLVVLDEPHRSATLSTDVLGPLFNHIKLEVLVVELDVYLTYNDDDVLKIAQAWPTLKRLELFCRTFTTFGVVMDISLPTPHALIHLAQHCPKLTHLKLGIFVSRAAFLGDSSALERMKTLRLHDHPLRTFQLAQGWSRTGSQQFAQLLDALFPNLDADACERTPSADAWADWKDLWDAVRQHQIERRTIVDAGRQLDS